MKVGSQPAAHESKRSQREEKPSKESSESRPSHECSHRGRDSVSDTLKQLFSGIKEGLEHHQGDSHGFNACHFDWLGDNFFDQHPPEAGSAGDHNSRDLGSGRYTGPASGSSDEPGIEPGSGSGSRSSSAAGSIDPYKLAPHQKYGYDCGVTATRSALRAAGFDGDQDAILDDAIAKGYHTGRDNGAWTGPANMSKYLQSYGINSENEAFSQKNIEKQLEEGNPVIVSTDRHYFVISGKDENGNYIVGDTGTVVNKGTTISYEDLAGFSGGHTLVTIDAQNPPESTRPPASKL